MEQFLALMIPIVAIVCIFGLPVILGAYVLVKVFSSNKNERMELARRGIIPPDRKATPPNKYRSLRNGILCIGIAIGLIVGIIIITNNVFREYIEFSIVISSVIMFLGIAYVLFYLLVRNKNIDNE